MADRPEDRRRLGLYLALAQSGMEMVVPLGVGLLLDRWLGITPWLTITGAVLGFVGGLAHMIVIMNRLDQNSSAPADGEQR
jgi:F0F1-type ATP synthase assembly protein I